MATDPVLDALEQTASRLSDEVRLIPQVQMLEEVRAMIAKRRAMAARQNTEREQGGAYISHREAPTARRRATTAALVEDAAAEFLRKINRRAQTSEIVAELNRQGVSAGKIENMVATVSSYLSSAKDRFDNVRGQGYGLVEWTMPVLDETTEEVVGMTFGPGVPGPILTAPPDLPTISEEQHPRLGRSDFQGDQNPQEQREFIES